MNELNKTKLILASTSPRRKELLEQVGLKFEVITSECDESTSENNPSKLVTVLANKKAKAVAKVCCENKEFLKVNNNFVVIGADTIVALDKQILGKPKNEEEALEMLMELSGKIHQVYTGVSIQVFKEGKIISKYFYEKTDVKMYEFNEKEALDYIATGEPLDKAGSYGIQGLGAILVKEIKGDYNTVVGLPVARVYRELINFLK